jgi:hypothetical protein
VLLADDQALLRATFRIPTDACPDSKSSTKPPTAKKAHAAHGQGEETAWARAQETGTSLTLWGTPVLIGVIGLSVARRRRS